VSIARFADEPTGGTPLLGHAEAAAIEPMRIGRRLPTCGAMLAERGADLRWMPIALNCLLAGCTAATPYIGTDAPLVDRGPNTAPRGSEEFCRTYAAQTTVNRIEMSRNGNGGGPNGFDRHLAGLEGERAFERCRSGRTN
jgi:hypothetical protein